MTLSIVTSSVPEHTKHIPFSKRTRIILAKTIKKMNSNRARIKLKRYSFQTKRKDNIFFLKLNESRKLKSSEKRRKLTQLNTNNGNKAIKADIIQALIDKENIYLNTAKNGK